MAGREQGPSRSDAAGSTRPAADGSGSGSVTESNDPTGKRSGGDGEAAGAGSRWRLRHWRLRTKLAAVLLIPAILALVFAGLRVAADTSSAIGLAKLSTQVQLQGKVNALVQQLQRERDLSVLYVASGHSIELRNLKEVRTKVDDASAAFQRAVNENADDINPATSDRFTTAVSELDQLSELRNAVENSDYPAAATEQAYTRFIDPLLNIGEQSVAGIKSPELVRLHLASNAIAQMKESGSERRALLLQEFQAGKAGPTLRRDVISAEAKRRAAKQDFEKFATAEQQGWYDNTVTGPLVDKANKIVESAITHGLVRLPTDTPVRTWDNAATVTIDLTHQVEQALHGELVDRTNQLAAAAKASAIRDGAIVLGVLALAALFALFVARSLLWPLRTLRRSALAMAEHRLPEEVEQILADPDPEGAARRAVTPVPVHTREEVGQVARSFDAVHGEAVRLAAEQALLRDSVNSMFVNLSRRSQALVERQLSVIDRLEADEQDPDQLGSLFELDHLATRMRRNSENLLVLSGTEFGRRMSRPVPVAEVLGAAVSEVEQYARVELGSSPELTVVGRAVNDIVHLVAELLDNATVYSDPQTKVGVRSVRNRAGAWAIEISDSGVGMSDVDLAAANERLAEPPDVDVSVSRRMGLYVVARLSKQHDITVSLRENEEAGGGVVARVVVPPELVRGENEPQQTQQSGAAEAFGGRAAAMSALPSTTQSDVLAPVQEEPGTELAAPAMATADAQTELGLPVSGGEPRPSVPGDEPDPAVARSAAPLPKRDGSLARNRRDRINRLSGGTASHGAPESGDLRAGHEPGGERWQQGDEPPVADEPPVPAEQARQEPAAANGMQPPAAEQRAEPQAAEQQAVVDPDGPTVRLPIYEQVLSQWFTDEPVEAAAPLAPERPRQAPAERLPTRVPGAAGQSRRETMPAGASSYEPRGGDGAHSPEHGESARGAGQEQPQQSQPQQGQPSSGGWRSPADEGWQAVRALDQPAEQVTKAGLPKRKPKAQLVPGSAPQRATPPAAAGAVAGQGASTQVTTPPRSAEAVRGRMSSLQQGVRRGRHERTESYPGSRSADANSEGREQQ